MRGTRDRGEAVVSYAALLVLLAGIVGVLGSTIVAPVSSACQQAICDIFGGGCGKSGHGSPQPQPALYNQPPRTEASTAPVYGRRPLAQPGTCAPQQGNGGLPLHAHNDYLNKHPVDDALGNGATSVEADIWDDGSNSPHLGHDAKGKVKTKDGTKTVDGNLKDTYLDDLKRRAEQNGGKVVPGQTAPIQLVVEIKDKDPAKKKAAYDEAVREAEAELGPYLYSPSNPNGSIQLVFTGGYPADSDPPPYVYYDGFFESTPDGCKVPDKIAHPGRGNPPTSHYAMISGDWTKCADTNKDGKIDANEQAKLNAAVAQAHAQNLPVRFWGTPDYGYAGDGDTRDHKGHQGDEADAGERLGGGEEGRGRLVLQRPARPLQHLDPAELRMRVSRGPGRASARRR